MRDLIGEALSRAQAEHVMRDVLGRMSGRWSIGVLCTLAKNDAPIRFSRMLREVDGITQKVLTTTLRHLERDGLVSRRGYAQVPPRVEYALTPLGRELYSRVEPLVDWAMAQADAFRAAHAAYALQLEAE